MVFVARHFTASPAQDIAWRDVRCAGEQCRGGRLPRPALSRWCLGVASQPSCALRYGVLNMFLDYLFKAVALPDITGKENVALASTVNREAEACMAGYSEAWVSLGGMGDCGCGRCYGRISTCDSHALSLARRLLCGVASSRCVFWDRVLGGGGGDSVVKVNVMVMLFWCSVGGLKVRLG
ncbi:hypothetical protein E2C01_059072 [Portunus trituberculatus]|uniref:Uncharacterized protein n=1 Tax=Portunus trituberculatus TaxID=210409 RepID=A0A5B7GY55_PORTR|nr:hypothetical protein [Portunus trituberculatus]